ncbi:MAG TPA: glycosyltransferase family 9 protein, partial [Candidatus Baltobacteraceae bacterium]|nr:glycosyltransferase family 9 protein [Candidatus Baltobacteraceae bacterium]
MREPRINSPSRIVLTRLDRMGDMILSTPAIASARRSWPNAHITLACSRRNATVVEENPYIDELFVVPSGVRASVSGAKLGGGVDLAIALAPREEDYAFVRATGAPKRIGYTYVRRFVARLFARRYLTDVGISEADPDLADRDPAYIVRHEVDQVNAVIALAGGTRLEHDLVVPVGPADRARVAHVPAGGIAFHLAPRWYESGSTLESLLELLRELRAIGVPLVVTYGADAADAAGALRRAEIADVVIGDLAFLEWAAVFERSAIVVTVDTSATHLASAMKRPTVVLFERRWFRLSSQEWAPYRVPSVILRKPVDASPASLEGMREAVVIAA